MRVLALNGGGTAGIATCLLLERLEQETGVHVADLFDLVVGVSTGAIIAGAICTGMRATNLVDLYLNDIPDIFHSRYWPVRNGYLGAARYDADHFDAVLEDLFRSCEIGDASVDCMILATQVAPRLQLKLWKSWMSDGNPAPLRDIIRASCSAPTYFDPKDIGDRTYIDGGIIANNPSMLALVEALKIRGDAAAITLVNIQLGDAPLYPRSQAHRLHTVFPSVGMLIDILLNANVEMSEYLTKNLIDRYINLDFNFTEPLDHWSEAFVSKARNMVEQMWSVHGNRLVNALTSSKHSVSHVKGIGDSTTKKLAVLPSDPLDDLASDLASDLETDYANETESRNAHQTDPHHNH
jgi:uncharacterized protein